MSDDSPLVVLVPYDDAWPAKFEAERDLLEAALEGWIYGGIEHVGSTSVPGLAAKPIIDIMVGVRDLEEGRGAFPALAELGYLYAPYKSQFMHWFCKPSVAVRTHHLYLMEKDHPEWRAHIAFRDHLRAHPETAEAYEQLKRELVQRFRNDREAYTRAKGEFVAQVVAAAAASAPLPPPSAEHHESGATYDPVRITRFFDSFAEQEWPRLDSDPAQRISFHLHRRMLEAFVKPGDRVLEVGAGPGRFTIELARIGARTTVTDISPVQLELNHTRLVDTGHADGVTEWRLADVTDMSGFANDSFDTTVALGGPLSYVLDRRAEAVAEIVRVTKPGGHIIISVMSRAGAFRKFLSGLLALYETNDAETIRVINDSMATGDVVDPRVQTEDHYMHLFTAAELRSLLEEHDLEVPEMSAANFMTVQNEDWLAAVDEDSDFWRFVVQLEERFASESGALDGGTHILAAARKPLT
jgi:GrpB-like predicted nucleotidyltransferase (UPF0157 family)/ubiquinone/menaquinone biosynthesis C-methylase UbiE